MDHARLLIADYDSRLRNEYATIFAQAGHRIDTASTSDEVLAKVRATPYDLLLQEVVFEPSDGIALLKQVKQLRPAMLVVLSTARASVDKVLGAFRTGAFDFVEKPVSEPELLELAARAQAIRTMGTKRRQLAEQLESQRHRVMQLEQQLSLDDPFARIVGHSRAVQQVIETVREVARTDSTVLITGESGTGKGLVARTIHEASGRREGPFVEANCVVYSEGVLHSELFGHEKGAFTGAARMKKGRFELAHDGTLFLDEIGEISHSTQLFLLRVLQDRTFERVGGEQTLEANVRLIAATNRDLQQALRQGSFRSDLFYRLNVIPLRMPSLRERPEDVPVLAQSFLSDCAERLGREVEGFTPQAQEALVRYPWPGNVRELQNLIERLVVLNHSGVVELQDLPSALLQGVSDPGSHSAPGTLQSMERARIAQALSEAGGNKKKTAANLGIHRSTLYAKMRRYGLMEDRSGDNEAERREEQHEPSETATLVPTS